MNISLPPQQQAFVEGLVNSGQFASANEAIVACVRWMQSREKLREQVKVGVDEADRGELIDHATVFKQLQTRG
jgi:antitoxin ParD1/3/4